MYWSKYVRRGKVKEEVSFTSISITILPLINTKTTQFENKNIDFRWVNDKNGTNCKGSVSLTL